MVLKDSITTIEYISFDLSRSIICDSVKANDSNNQELPLINAWVKQKQKNVLGHHVKYRQEHVATDLSQLLASAALQDSPLAVTVFAQFTDLPRLISSKNTQSGLVMHVPITKGILSTLSEISFIQSSGVLVLVSTNPEQAQRHSLLSYLASQSSVVVHLYYVAQDDTPYPVPYVAAADFEKYFTDNQLRPSSVNAARGILAAHNLASPAFEYIGSPSSRVLLSLGSFLPWIKSSVDPLTKKPLLESIFLAELSSAAQGLVQTYQLSPWAKEDFLKSLPSNCDNIKLVLPPTFASSPCHAHVISSFVSNSMKPDISFLEEGFSLAHFFLTLVPASPESVNSTRGHLVSSEKVAILKSVFKDSLKVFESNGSSEAAFGSLLSELHRVQVASQSLHDIASSSLAPPSVKKLALELVSQSSSNLEKVKKSFKELDSLLDTHALDHLYTPIRDYTIVAKISRWLVDHGSLLDVSSSLIHTIVSSKENMNVLIIDRNKYDTNQLQSKRDAGLYALNYGGAYVASICPSYSFSQAVQALTEAAAFQGPSIVTLLAPDFDSPLDCVASCKKLIDSGLYSLYRWTPGCAATKNEPNLVVDSSKAKATIEKFLEKNSNLALVLESDNLPAHNNAQRQDLEAKLELHVKAKMDSSYKALFGNLNRKKLLILFGSDGGNGESLAKRIAMEAKEKGLFVKIYAGDSFIAEDITKEEHVLFVVSTAGQGEFPGNFRDTWKSLSSNAFDFGNIHYSVFALGDRHYWPRTEDSHYFAKPGKDLDQKISALGGKRLTDLGIGDDRDPDGYFTGFAVWAPLFWTSLGVEAEAITGPAPPTDDAIKLASNYLRGTIAEGLADTSTGALAEFDTKLTKFHGIYQQDDRDIREHRLLKGMEKAFSFMIRVRVPGGISTAAQYLAMDEISDKWANGTIKITTRQAFQFHGVVKSVLKRTIQDINCSLLDTIAACGDVNRNVMCNPNPSDSRVHQAVLDLSNGLSAHLTPATTAYHEIWLDKKLVAGGEDHEPLYGKTYLPRKFKIAIAVPPSNDVDVFAHDLGYIAIVENGSVIGYNVTVGGGMGQTHGNKKTYPVLAKLLGFCTPEQAIQVGEKVMLVQRDYGERVNRKHARLKYTIEDKGLDWFRSEVESRLGYKLQPPKPYKFTSNGDRYGWAHTGDGEWSYTLFIQNGRIKDTSDYRLKTGLREIAKVHNGGFALTPNQHLVISKISPSKKSQISDLLVKYGIDNSGLSGLRLNSMACVALPTCALAMAESERYLPVLVTKIEDMLERCGLREDAITIRMTGCPNGCARPSIAEIAFIGKAPGMYNMYLGGGFNGERLNRLYRESIDEKEILRLLEPLIEEYAKQRHEGEHFGDYLIRKQVV